MWRQTRNPFHLELPPIAEQRPPALVRDIYLDTEAFLSVVIPFAHIRGDGLAFAGDTKSKSHPRRVQKPLRLIYRTRQILDCAEAQVLLRMKRWHLRQSPHFVKRSPNERFHVNAGC